MKWFSMLIQIVAVSVILLLACSSFAQEKKTDSVLEDIFNSIDTNKDGKISHEEWNTIDTNKDGKINQKEWERYTYKSQPEKSKWFDIKWFDNNGDSYMDREEFFIRNRRQP